MLSRAARCSARLSSISLFMHELCVEFHEQQCAPDPAPAARRKSGIGSHPLLPRLRDEPVALPPCCLGHIALHPNREVLSKRSPHVEVTLCVYNSLMDLDCPSKFDAAWLRGWVASPKLGRPRPGADPPAARACPRIMQESAAALHKSQTRARGLAQAHSTSTARDDSLREESDSAPGNEL